MSKEIIRHHFLSIDSTNGWAKRQLNCFAMEALTIISAAKQEAGYGQFGRKWHSEADNIYVSFVFFMEPDSCCPITLTHLLALSAISLLEKHGIQGSIKRPNDLKVQGRKIGGILCETQLVKRQMAVVLGLGFNVNLSAQECTAISQPATSLFLETGRHFSSEELLNQLSKDFAHQLEMFIKKGFTPFAEKLKKFMTSI